SRQPRRVPLLPYTTLFRSASVGRASLRVRLQDPQQLEAARRVIEGVLGARASAPESQETGHITAPLANADRLLDVLAALRQAGRSEEHTSELQSREKLVCR